MFKKSIVALAVAGIAGNALAAADLAGGVTTRTVSVEGVTTATKVAAPAVSITLGAEYTVGDILTLTFTGADLDTTALPASLNPTLVDGADTMTLGLLNATTTQATYRVTELTYDGLNAETTIGATVDFTAETHLIFDKADLLASGSVSATYAAETSTGVALDTPAGTDGTAVLLDTQDQFSASVTTAFDATIDVNQNRLAFDDGTGVTTDGIVITPVNDAAGVVYDATPTNMIYTIYGDWSILDDDPDTAGVQLNNAAAITIVGGGTLTSVDAEKIIVEHAGVAAQTVTVDVSDDALTAGAVAPAALAEQDFTVDVEVEFTDHGTDSDSTNVAGAVAGDSALLSGGAAGDWGLNGSVVEVPYVPFGPVTQPIIRHTNTGTQTGDITLRYMVEGEHTAWQDAGLLVSAAAPGVRNLLSEVSSTLATEGYDAATTGFKVALEFTTNVPNGDVTMTVGAKFSNQVDTDRLTVGTFN
ncbi:hypothetical protein [Alteromonas facilis]|uniref:hypothetical protein n=1 Tax=Alteromonas facilis TaxID=2048004 RepID=UPI000F5CE977|nr:hypothetical protein [Alteromonas facilis]